MRQGKIQMRIFMIMDTYKYFKDVFLDSKNAGYVSLKNGITAHCRLSSP